ncbi:MAG TPA: class I SAM-dependent methyltransferase [Planctomycetota bacterium]|nr:class I SAM-dependent methyltransferase [Planctomycetota bacterium]
MSELERAVQDACAAGMSVEGWMQSEELRFLFLAAAQPTVGGEILEIGSYRGRSTVVLAKGALLAGQDKVVACDPFVAARPTDPDPSGPSCEAFLANLQRHGVEQHVEFHRTWSTDLARTWDRPIRLLWVDGDHAYAAVHADVEAFLPHLVPGALLVLHDVNRAECPGPTQCFMEDVLLSDQFGRCGLCKSIGWAQSVGEGGRREFTREKATLCQVLAARRLKDILGAHMPRRLRWQYRKLRKGADFEHWLLSACQQRQMGRR